MSLVLKALGKLHAVNFAIKDQQPEKFKQLSSLAPEHVWAQCKESDPHISSKIARLIRTLEKEKRFDLLEKYRNVVGDDFCDTLRRQASGEAAEPYAVICHGTTIFKFFVLIHITIYQSDW